MDAWLPPTFSGLHHNLDVHAVTCSMERKFWVTRFVNQASPDNTQFHQSAFLSAYLSKGFKANEQDLLQKDFPSHSEQLKKELRRCNSILAQPYQRKGR